MDEVVELGSTSFLSLRGWKLHIWVSRKQKLIREGPMKKILKRKMQVSDGNGHSECTLCIWNLNRCRSSRLDALISRLREAGNAS